MSSVNILQAADRLAARLESLPEVNEAFPYPKPISAMQLGDLILAITGSSPPGTHGEHGWQTVVFHCVVKLGSGMVDIDGGKELHDKIASLCSARNGEGIIGTLRQSPDLRQYGDPRVTEDGCEVTYDEEADDNILTFVECDITANIRIA